MQLPIDPMTFVPLSAIGVLALVAGVIFRRKGRSTFVARSLVNKSERRLFDLLRSELPDDLWIFPQVSYGAMLKNRSYKRYMSVNAKRADYVVCDRDLHPVPVIEYQGAGHYGKTSKSRANAERRDRTKRQALKDAGLPLLEIPAQFDRASVRTAVAPWAKTEMAALGREADGLT